MCFQVSLQLGTISFLQTCTDEVKGDSLGNNQTKKNKIFIVQYVTSTNVPIR